MCRSLTIRHPFPSFWTQYFCEKISDINTSSIKCEYYNITNILYHIMIRYCLYCICSLSYLTDSGLINLWSNQLYPENYIHSYVDKWSSLNLNQFRTVFVMYIMGNILAIMLILIELVLGVIFKMLIIVSIKNI